MHRPRLHVSLAARSARRGAAAAGLAALLLCAGCVRAVYEDQFAAKLVRGQNEVGFADGGGDLFDRYVGVKTQKKAQGTGFGFARLTRDLWPPFRVEVTAGAFDPSAAPLVNTRYCMELDVRGTKSGNLEFYALCVDVQPSGGLVAFAGSHVPGQLTGIQVLPPGVDRVVLAIEHDGTDLIFQVADASPADGGFLEVDRIDDFTPTAALLPSIGAAFLTHPTTVGFDDLRVVSNGDPPGEPTAQQQVVRDLYDDAVDSLAEAWRLLDGAAPDTTGARTAVLDAGSALDEAVTSIEALEPSKDVKKALGKIKKAAKKADGVVAQIDKGAPVKKLISQLEKTLKLVLDAIGFLDPAEA